MIKSRSDYTISISALFLALLIGLLYVQEVHGDPSVETGLSFPTQSLVIAPSSISGHIAYPVRQAVSSEGHFPFNVIIWETGEKNTRKASYQIISQDAYPFATQFAPDGWHLLIETSTPTSFLDEYQFVILNIRTGKYQEGPHIQFYPAFSWSADSRYVAYFEGGNNAGEEAAGVPPLELHIYAVDTGQSHMVAQNSEVKSFAWTYSGTLLYSAKQTQPGESIYNYTKKHASIYEVSASVIHPKRLIESAFEPCPSPDGRWIAFLGWRPFSLPKQATSNSPSDAKNEPKQVSAERFGVYLYRHSDQHIILLHPLQEGESEYLAWSADSKQLVSLQAKYDNTHPAAYTSENLKDYPGYGTATITSTDINSLKPHIVTTITSTDLVAGLGSRMGIQLRGVFRNAGTDQLYLSIHENKKTYTDYRFLAINLQNGDITSLLTGRNIDEVDWQKFPLH